MLSRLSNFFRITAKATRAWAVWPQWHAKRAPRCCSKQDGDGSNKTWDFKLQTRDTVQCNATVYNLQKIYPGNPTYIHAWWTNWLKMPQARGRHRSTTVLPRSTWDMQWTELQRVTTSTLSEINLNMSEHCKRSSYDWYETYRNMIGSEIHHLLVWQFLLLAPE